MDASSFIQELKGRLVINYTFLSATSVLICDYFSMLHLEIKLIWFSKWTYTKILFLLIRYTAFVGVAFLLHDQMIPNLTVKECKMTYPIAIWSLASQTFLAEAMFSIRTWAVWQRNRVIGILLGSLTVASTVTQCIVLNTFTKSITYAPRPYPDFGGCFITGANTTGAGFKYPYLFTVLEATIFALMTISAVRSYRRGDRDRLSMVVHRDAILFYACIICITVMIFMPFYNWLLWVNMALALYSAVSARMILNIRCVGDRGMETELHDDSPVFTTDIWFAPNDHSDERATVTQPPRDLEDCDLMPSP